MFTISALVTLALGAAFGITSAECLVSDIEDKRQRRWSRRWNIAVSSVFVVAAFCAMVTACHNLTHIWIR